MISVSLDLTEILHVGVKMLQHQESVSFTLSPILILCKIIIKSDILPGLKNYSFSPEPKSLSYFMYLNLS